MIKELRIKAMKLGEVVLRRKNIFIFFVFSVAVVFVFLFFVLGVENNFVFVKKVFSARIIDCSNESDANSNYCKKYPPFLYATSSINGTENASVDLTIYNPNNASYLLYIFVSTSTQNWINKTNGSLSINSKATQLVSYNDLELGYKYTFRVVFMEKAENPKLKDTGFNDSEILESNLKSDIVVDLTKDAGGKTISPVGKDTSSNPPKNQSSVPISSSEVEQEKIGNLGFLSNDSLAGIGIGIASKNLYFVDRNFYPQAGIVFNENKNGNFIYLSSDSIEKGCGIIVGNINFFSFTGKKPGVYISTNSGKWINEGLINIIRSTINEDFNIFDRGDYICNYNNAEKFVIRRDQYVLVVNYYTSGPDDFIFIQGVSANHPACVFNYGGIMPENPTPSKLEVGKCYLSLENFSLARWVPTGVALSSPIVINMNGSDIIPRKGTWCGFYSEKKSNPNESNSILCEGIDIKDRKCPDNYEFVSWEQWGYKMATCVFKGLDVPK